MGCAYRVRAMRSPSVARFVGSISSFLALLGSLGEKIVTISDSKESSFQVRISHFCRDCPQFRPALSPALRIAYEWRCRH
jgi:hypothetical protein